MEEINEQVQERIKKLDRMREEHIDPYGGAFPVTGKAADIVREYDSLTKEQLDAENVECTVAGRIISFRNFGKTAFAHIQDGTGRVQLYFSKDVITGTRSIFKNLDIGDIIGVSGKLGADRDMST